MGKQTCFFFYEGKLSSVYTHKKVETDNDEDERLQMLTHRLIQVKKRRKIESAAAANIQSQNRDDDVGARSEKTRNDFYTNKK